MKQKHLNAPHSEKLSPTSMKALLNPSRGILALLYALCSMLLWIPGIVCADVEDFLSKFHPSLTVQEEYNSNINLTARNRIDDYITTIYPGLKFSTSGAGYGIDLGYRLGLVYYAHEEDNNYTSHEGTLNTFYTWAQRLTFRVRDYFIRSDEVREREYSAVALEDQYLLSTTRKRVIYWRNVAEPSMEYRFGKEDRISLFYRNNIYEIKGREFEDSREDYINPKLTYWLTVRHGIALEYGLTLGDFERSPDLTGHMATGRYTYRFNPKTSIFGEYTFLRRDFEPPSTDYDIHRGSIGMAHAFSPTLTASVQAGYFWQEPDRGSKTDGVFYIASATQQAEKTTYTLSFQGGYTEDYFTAENIGFTKYHRGVGTITYRLFERMTAGLSGYVEWVDYPSDPADREDLIWGARGNLAYQIFKWLSASLEGSHRRNNSKVDVYDYSEYRGIFRITASF